VGRIATAFSVAFILSATSASAAELPARKAGLWEITIAGDHAIKVRQCSDAASDQVMEQAVTGLPGECAKRDVEKSGSTITVVSVCTSGHKSTTSHMVISGNLDSDYTMTMTSEAAGQADAPPMTMSAKWLGPCEKDQRPGDVIMPNGAKINIVNQQKSVDRAAR